MYIWGIFLMLGCLAKSSQACSYLSHNSWSEHVKQKFSDGFSGCQDYEFTGINILTLVKDLVATIDEIAIAELSVDYIEEGTWVLKALLSVHLGCKGFSGSVLEVKVNGKLRLSIDNECGCPQYEILAGSLELFVSVLNLPLVDLKLLGFLGILTGSLKTQLSDGFIGSLTVLLKETITTTCHSVVDTINLEFKSVTEIFSYGGQSWSYKATSLAYTDYGCVTSLALVNEVTGLTIGLAGGIPLTSIYDLTADLIRAIIISVECLTSLFSSTTENISQLTYTVKDFLALGIFTQITGVVTVAYNQISHECTSNADGTWLTQIVELNFQEAGKTFLSVTVTLKKTLELVTGGRQIWIKQGISEIIETIVTFGGENCGCPDESILGILEEILLKLIQYIDNEQGSKSDQYHLPNPSPWEYDSGDSHSCNPHDQCVSCS